MHIFFYCYLELFHRSVAEVEPEMKNSVEYFPERFKTVAS